MLTPSVLCCQGAYAGLELWLLQQSILIGIDEAADPSPGLSDGVLEVILARRSLWGLCLQAPLILLLDLSRVTSFPRARVMKIPHCARRSRGEPYSPPSHPLLDPM